MNYISLYRKWRSQNFDEVLGQEHVTRTLKNAVAKGRIAHAYLFAGPRGTGKTSTARILAKALNCQNGPTADPCLKCRNCEHIKEGTSLDVLEIDAASNRGIDEIRELRERVRFAPVEGRYKVYIIDEVHMLTPEAFNALLKTLEEPPEHVVFILCTTEPQKLPPTILSRCQRFDFRRIPFPLLKKRFAQIVEAEGGKIEDGALDMVVQAASGSFRDGESILEQLLAYTGGEITANDARELLGLTEDEWLEKLILALLDGNYREIFEVIDTLISLGRDPRNISRDIIQFLRQLLAVSVGNPPSTWPERAEKLRVIASQTSTPAILSLLEPLAGLEWQMRSAVEPRYLLEMNLIFSSYRLQERIAGLRPPTAQPATKAQVVSEVKEALKESVPVQEGSDLKISLEEKGVLKETVSPLKRPLAFLEEINLDKLKEYWPSVLEKVKQKSVPTYILLSKGSLTDFADGQIILTFDRAFSFHKNMVEKGGNRLLIEEAIEETLGVKYALKCLLGNGESGESAEEIKNHPLVKQTLDLFEGIITEIKEE
ncbi:MAG: DNA polymerase III subunit gamma/tau [bacterium]